VSGLYEAALMAAGPDEVRGSDSNQNIEHHAHNPWRAIPTPGLNRFIITSSFTLALEKRRLA
jgi:hypothetical protein